VSLDIRLLGPVEVWDDGRRIELGPRKQRLVLAVLGLEVGMPVDMARLVDLAWPDSPPRTASHAIQVCVSGLRSALRGVAGADIRLHGSGYSLAADPTTIDVCRFRSLLARARGRADDLTRLELLDRALALWSGSALSGVAAPQTQQRLCAGLEEARLGALEDRLDAQLRLGRQRELLDELPGLVASHPLRERMVGQLMIALHRDGRAAEALADFRQYRKRLAEELGLDVGPALRELELAILRNDSLALTPSPQLTGAVPIAVEHAPGGSVPAQLPAAVAGFTGRGDALAELDTLLAARPPTGPIVVIAGSAGVGKTALAVHWAHRHRDAFPDGQLYVNLAGYAPGSPMSPQRALTGFLRALGVPAEKIPLEAGETAALYRSMLADRRMLVVLDNAYAPDQVRPLLPGGQGCLTVVTSRDQLAGLTAMEGAVLLPLGVLRTDEALGLLTGLLGARRVDTEPVATAEVAALCACLPLALRIAAAHLIRHPRQPVADLAADLREGNRLTVLSVAGDEQSAVRAAFDLSYATLQPAAQRVFLLAGLTPGADLSAAAAAALAGTDARQLLAELSRAHLVDEHAPGRFAMHDLLRLYAADRAGQELAAADMEAAAVRLCDFYLRATDAAARVLHPNMQRLSLPGRLGQPGLPERPGRPGSGAVVFGSHAEALGWLEAERPNLVAAVTRAAAARESRQREAAWLIADAMRGYFWMRRYAADWLAVAEAGLAAATAGDETRAMAAAHLSLAQAKRWLARYPDAATHLLQARDLALRAGWDEGAAAALGSLANVYRDQGRLADAAAHHRLAREIYQRTGSRGGEATSLGNLGNVLLELGRVAEALGYLTQSLAIYQEIGARPAEAHLLNSVGCAHLILGRSPDALAYLERALALHRETGSREGEADDLNNLAELHRDEGSHATARELASASLALARESGDQRIEVDANNTLGTVTRLLGDPATALRYHQRALETARKAGYRQGEAAAEIGLAQDQSDLGQHDEARASVEQALLTTRQTGLRLLEGHALTALAAIALESGQADEASASAAAALAVHRETGHRLGEARAARIVRRTGGAA
jgi:DNA-binding SARP family transcriptional activator/tetratricopeptide (TPR) repeat protein